MTSSVAAAWATMAGCIRNDGQVTPGPRSPRVRVPAAARISQTNEAWPWWGVQGWKWSAAMTPEKPAASARAHRSRISAGPNCSSIAA
jgi:hypothetical protein